MLTIGSGAVLLILAVLGACFAERRWLRTFCEVYLGLYVLRAVVGFIFWRLPLHLLATAIAVVVAAWLVLGARRGGGAS